MPKSLLTEALAHPAELRFAPDGAILWVTKSGNTIETQVLLPGPDSNPDPPAIKAEALAREIGGDLSLRVTLSGERTIVIDGATKPLLKYCDPETVQLACRCGELALVEHAVANGDGVVMLVKNFVERIHASDLQRSFSDDSAAWVTWRASLAAVSCSCNP